MTTHPETRAALDLILSVIAAPMTRYLRPLVRPLLTYGDHYMHLADLSLLGGPAAGELYADSDGWCARLFEKLAVLGNSRATTIAEYATQIWR